MKATVGIPARAANRARFFAERAIEAANADSNVERVAVCETYFGLPPRAGLTDR